MRWLIPILSANRAAIPPRRDENILTERSGASESLPRLRGAASGCRN